MAPRSVNALCKALGHYPKRTVVTTRPGGFIGQTFVTLDCRHEVPRYKRPAVGSRTLCEVCARWEGVRQRAAMLNVTKSAELETLTARTVDTPGAGPDNPSTSTT